MRDLSCTIQDPDSFSSNLLTEYIDKTPGLALANHMNGGSSDEIDILFIDADQVKLNTAMDIGARTEVVVVSSNNKYIHSLFKNHIADYLSKSDLTYARFLDSIQKIKRKKGQSNSSTTS